MSGFVKKRILIACMIAIVGITFQSASVWLRGIHYGQDSNDYMTCFSDAKHDGCARFILSNRINKYFFYCLSGGAILKATGSMENTVKTLIILQVLAAGLIPFLIFLAIARFSFKGAIAGALFAFILPDFSRWTPYLLTDTFFFFSNAFILFIISRIDESTSIFSNLFYALLIWISSLVRVTGLLFPIALGLGFLFSQKKSLGIYLAILGVIPAVVFFIATPAGGGLFANKGVDLIANMRQGYILGGLPGSPRVVISGYSSIVKLFAMRAYYFFLPAYAHHSLRHQIINTIIFVPLYILAIGGLWNIVRMRLREYYLLATACIICVFYHMAISMYTNVEPDHRFLIPVFPAIIVLASLKISFLGSARNGLSPQKL